jgi:hypothetical protein
MGINSDPCSYPNGLKTHRFSYTHCHFYLRQQYCTAAPRRFL